MITIRIDLPTMQATLHRLDPRRLDHPVVAAMNESLGYLQGEVQKRTPIDTGLGRGSVFTDLRGQPAGLRGIVASPLVHMLVLERGRKPGGRMPPVEAIRAWLVRKGGDASMAFVVARAIARRGLPAHKMFEESAAKGLGTVRAIFSRHLRGL